MAANHLSRAERTGQGQSGWATRRYNAMRAIMAQSAIPLDDLSALADARIKAQQSRAGKRGFQVTLVSKGPQALARVIGGDFQRKYGRPLQWQQLPNALREHERAATRAAYSVAGKLCECGCGRPATDRDHRRGWQAGHAPADVALLARPCHVAIEVARIRQAPLAPLVY